MNGLPGEATLLRIYLGEDDRWNGRPAYESIVLKARQARLAGATVLRGPMGYGLSARLRTAKILRLSDNLPVVVEIVDTEEAIQEFLPALAEVGLTGLITLEKVRVVRYGHPGKDETPAAS